MNSISLPKIPIPQEVVAVAAEAAEAAVEPEVLVTLDLETWKDLMLTILLFSRKSTVGPQESERRSKRGNGQILEES